MGILFSKSARFKLGEWYDGYSTSKSMFGEESALSEWCHKKGRPAEIRQLVGIFASFLGHNNTLVIGLADRQKESAANEIWIMMMAMIG